MHIYIVSILTLLLLLAAWQDIRQYRIKNALVITGALLGVLLHTLLPTNLSFFDALLGWLMGLLVLLPLYLLRAMGAGDVKLMAMVGAFLGPEATLTTLLYVLVTGGVLSVCIALLRSKLGQLFLSVRILISEFMTNLMTAKSKRKVPLSASLSVGERLEDSAKMPYGVAIAAGTFVFLFVHQSGFLSV